MFNEAERQGWLRNRDLGTISELMSMYKNAANYFVELIDDADSGSRESIVYHTCRYLFAKGVEGVILWGIAPSGNISVYFEPKHLLGEIETEVPKHLHKVVCDSMSVADGLFKAHQNFIIESQKSSRPIDLKAEIVKTVEWIPRFGISYALFKQYQVLR